METLEPEDKKPTEKRNFTHVARGFMSGSLLRMPQVQQKLKYALIVAGFMLAYIALGYQAQLLSRRHSRLNDEVKELRAKSLSLSERRMTATRQSEIIRALREHGIELEESVVPPRIVE